YLDADEVYDIPLSHGSSAPPVHDLAVLDRLPLEILHLIYRILHIKSLFIFRAINRMAKRTLESLTDYRLVHLHAQEPLLMI
ncbi:MAG: hypothetical protein M1835_001307, partial [Candelina submexicana]